MSNVSLQTMAVDYARQAKRTESVKATILAHEDFQTYLNMAAAPKVGKASPVVAAAKAMLGITDERGTKTGPAGGQTYTKYEPVTLPDGTNAHLTGQHVEYVAMVLKGALSSDKGNKPVVLRATLSGEGGGSVTIPTDSPLYAQIVAMIKGDGESDDSE